MDEPDEFVLQHSSERVSLETLHARNHFTSSVSGSLVAKYEGWYIGSTLAGLTRNTPGFTTFSRYTYSCAPREKYVWKKAARSSWNSRRVNHHPHQRGASFISYKLSRCTNSVPAGMGSSIIRYFQSDPVTVRRTAMVSPTCNGPEMELSW